MQGNQDELEDLRSVKKCGWFGEYFECCPWKKFHRPNPLLLARWKFRTPNNSNIPEEKNELENILPCLKIKREKLHNPPEDKIQVTWIGHATVLVQFDGATVLTDPVFGEYCGPKLANELGLSYKRYRQAPCTIEDLPTIDAVVISHNHYDHLEESAVKEIAKKHKDAKWFVTLKQRQWISDCNVPQSNIHELDWWEEKNIKIKDNCFDFICTPSQHWCQRSISDKNTVLWCSWAIKGPKKSFFFAGDTGYYERLFKTIGNKYGPFDLAAIPIGAYEPRFITAFQHVDPAEAVKIHTDVKSEQSIGIHWGTFELTNEFYAEPPNKVEEEMKKLGKPDKFISLCHGETWIVGEHRKRPPFMDEGPPQNRNNTQLHSDNLQETDTEKQSKI